MCPVRKVCTKQCLSVADGIQQMVATNTLPNMGLLQEEQVKSPRTTLKTPMAVAPGRICVSLNNSALIS